MERLEEKGMTYLHFNVLTQAALLHTDHSGVKTGGDVTGLGSIPIVT